MNPQNHHRRSIRLKGYYYTQPGAYFVTICTYQREETFGEIVEGEMQLSPLGKIVREEWSKTAAIRSNVELHADEFVIMPNHFHGIVWIIETQSVVWADGVRPVEQPGTKNEGTRREGGACHAPLRRVPRSLSSFIAGFKAAVTSRAGRELNAANIWQRNYYEHIVRNENELKNFWNYIDTNPLRWQDDRLRSSAPSNQFNRDNL